MKKAAHIMKGLNARLASMIAGLARKGLAASGRREGSGDASTPEGRGKDFQRLLTVRHPDGTASVYDLKGLLALPMLTRRTMWDYPRFRDVFINPEEEMIIVMTRVGGDNRFKGMGEEDLYLDDDYAWTYDDEIDSTYGYYVFRVPERWRKDFRAIAEERYQDISEACYERIWSFAYFKEVGDELWKLIEGYDLPGRKQKEDMGYHVEGHPWV